MSRALRAALAAVLVAAGFPAAAEDFEAEVPVKITRLDATFTQGRVTCSVYGPTQNVPLGDGVSRPLNESYGVIGSGESTFPISRGAYEGVVAVRFPANRLSQAADARDYTCRLTLVSVGGTTSLCVVDLGAHHVTTHALTAPKIAASQPCTTGKLPRAPKP